MAQAATANTDELLSQLASSEIDRLLAEADGNPAPSSDEKRSQNSSVATGSERAALLEAAGFESSTPAPAPPANDPPAEAAPPVEDERAALLQAAGFESPIDMGLEPKTDLTDDDAKDRDHLPIYLKPLVWINAPLESCPPVIRPMLGKVGIVTLLNALAVLTYVIFFRKH